MNFFNTTPDSIKLSSWIIKQFPDSSVSPLKLQKIAFYCYAAAASEDMESEIGNISFQAWKYGPVIQEVYRKFKSLGSRTISHKDVPRAPRYSEELEELMRATCIIYGTLDAGELVRQTHLEDPWINAYKKQSGFISNEDIKSYFKARFAKGQVRIPEFISDSGFFEVDNLPVKKFQSLREMAVAIHRYA